MKKIAIFQEDLSVGGIQKSLLNLLGTIDPKEYAVTLFLLREDNFYQAQLPKEVKVVYLNHGGLLKKYLPYRLQRLFYGRSFRALGDFDIAIDFNSYQVGCSLGATEVGAKRRISWIHNDVEVKFREEWKYRLLWRNFRGKFRYFDEFVAVSDGIREPFRNLAKTGDKPIHVIHNHIDTEEIFSRMDAPVTDLTVDPGCFNLVALGKLCHQKAYDIMLDVIADVYEKRRDIRLYVLGEGPDRAALEEKRHALGLDEIVFFIGKRPNPYPYLHAMDAFLSTSRYEGQPLNIMEAKAVGLPIYMTKNLEKYCDGIPGCEDIRKALLSAERQEKTPDRLTSYNEEIDLGIRELLK